MPRAGLGKPWSASNANKPASSWPLKQGPKSGQNMAAIKDLDSIEEWERNLCENKAVAILERMQAGRPAPIKKDGGEMLLPLC